MADALPPCLGALALELSPGHPAPPTLVELEATRAIAEGLALDLARVADGVEAGDLAVAGAAFDPAELLRPGWPVHRALAELAARAPGAAGGRVLAFGAREGRIGSEALTPDPRLAGGALRLLPWLVAGEHLDAVAAALEAELLDRGMASAATALAAQEALGAPVEHVRLLTLHDLAALTAMQYRHAGLEPLWQLVETALLAPGQDCLVEGDGPTALWRAGRVLLAEPDLAAFAESGAAAAGDDGMLEQAFADHQMQLRQYAAVLAVHGIESERVAVAEGEDAANTLRTAP